MLKPFLSKRLLAKEKGRREKPPTKLKERILTHMHTVGIAHVSVGVVALEIDLRASVNKLLGRSQGSGTAELGPMMRTSFSGTISSEDGRGANK